MRVKIKDIVNFYKKYPEYRGKIDVATRYGYYPILDADKTAINEVVYEVKTVDDKILKCSGNHLLWKNGEWCKVKNLNNGDMIHTSDGDQKLKYVKRTNKRQDLYDLQVFEVEEYFTNGITSHNSSICDAFYYALFDKTIRDIAKPLIVNNVTKGKGNVELEFDVIDEQGSKSYVIKRQVKPSKVELYCNGEDITNDSIKNTNEYICELVGSNAVLCKSCDILSLSDNTPFMAKKPEDKRKFINDIFSLEVFGKMLKDLKSMVTENNKDISVTNTKLSEVKNTIELLERQNAEYDKKIKEQEEIIKSKREALEKNIADTEKSISLIKIGEVDTLKAEKVKYEKGFAKLEEKILGVNSKISEQRTLRKMKYQEIESFSKVEGVKCDKCLQDIPHTHIEHLTTLKGECEKEYDKIENDLSKLIFESDSLNENKSKINKKIKEITDNIQIQKSEEQKLEYLKKNLEYLKKNLVEIEDERMPEFKSDIEPTIKRKEDAEKELAELRQKESDYEICKFILGDDGVKSFIVKRLLDMLNNGIQKYITDLGMTMRCQFDEFFEDKMTNDKGKDISYWNLSGGERRTVDLACAWAFKDIKRSISGVHSNVEFGDEIFDNFLDSVGFDLLIETMKKRIEKNNLCVYAISHRKEMMKHITQGEVVWLEKENGVTRRVSKD